LLGCDRHKVIGHLHEFWWWALDNADADGMIGRLSDKDLSKAADWPLRSASRWSRSLLESGFIECKEGLYVIHDWFDFAGKLYDQRELRRISNRDRQRRHRERAGNAVVTRDGNALSPVYRPTVPTDHVVVGNLKAPSPRARSQDDPDGSLARSEVSDIGTGAQQCPICRQVFTGTYLEHTSERHKIRDQPEDFRGKRGSVPYAQDYVPPEINPAELLVEHDRLLAKDRANGT